MDKRIEDTQRLIDSDKKKRGIVNSIQKTADIGRIERFIKNFKHSSEKIVLEHDGRDLDVNINGFIVSLVPSENKSYQEAFDSRYKKLQNMTEDDYRVIVSMMDELKEAEKKLEEVKKKYYKMKADFVGIELVKYEFAWPFRK